MGRKKPPGKRQTLQPSSTWHTLSNIDHFNSDSSVLHLVTETLAAKLHRAHSLEFGSQESSEGSLSSEFWICPYVVHYHTFLLALRLRWSTHFWEMEKCAQCCNKYQQWTDIWFLKLVEKWPQAPQATDAVFTFPLLHLPPKSRDNSFHAMCRKAHAQSVKHQFTRPDKSAKVASKAAGHKKCKEYCKDEGTGKDDQQVLENLKVEVLMFGSRNSTKHQQQILGTWESQQPEYQTFNQKDHRWVSPQSGLRMP